MIPTDMTTLAESCFFREGPNEDGRKASRARRSGSYVIAQLSGGLIGAYVANIMFSADRSMAVLHTVNWRLTGPISPQPDLEHQGHHVDTAGLVACRVVFPLIIQLGGKAFREHFLPSDRHSVPGPAVVL
jgi:hypothetical protein